MLGAVAMDGSGPIWSVNTSKRFRAVPSGVQVIKVITGLELSVCNELTSVGFTTCVCDTRYT